jgi:hypothetical protein
VILTYRRPDWWLNLHYFESVICDINFLIASEALACRRIMDVLLIQKLMKLEGDDVNVYMMSIYDLYSSGIMVIAVSQDYSDELFLPISEMEVQLLHHDAK